MPLIGNYQRQQSSTITLDRLPNDLCSFYLFFRSIHPSTYTSIDPLVFTFLCVYVYVCESVWCVCVCVVKARTRVHAFIHILFFSTRLKNFSWIDSLLTDHSFYFSFSHFQFLSTFFYKSWQTCTIHIHIYIYTDINTYINRAIRKIILCFLIREKTIKSSLRWIERKNAFKSFFSCFLLFFIT